MDLIRFTKDRKVRQSLLLLFTSFIVMAIMIMVNFFLTRIFEKEIFGNYSLILNIFTFSQIIFNFGIFQSICRLIVKTDDKQEIQEYYASGIIIVLGLFVLMSVCLTVYTFMIMDYKKQLIVPMSISILFGWVYLLTNFYELSLQSSNRILLLSQVRLVPRFFFLSFLIIIYYFSLSSNLSYIILSYFLSFTIPYIYILKQLKPSFKNQTSRIKHIIEANKAFGFNIYLGSIFSVGASSLSGILISYFGVNNIEVGYYSLASQLSIPLSLIPNVIATVFFKKFANSKYIDQRLTYIMIFISTFFLIFIVVTARPFILIVYGKEYFGAINLLYFSAFGSILYGIADFYNRFLLSNGRGKELRNSSFIVGTVLFISNLVLINKYAGIGASISQVISGFTYLMVIIYYYRKIVSISSDR